MLCSNNGIPWHLTSDLLEKLPHTTALHVSLADMFVVALLFLTHPSCDHTDLLKKWGKGWKELSNMPPNKWLFLDSTDPSIYFESTQGSVVVQTKAGRSTVCFLVALSLMSDFCGQLRRSCGKLETRFPHQLVLRHYLGTLQKEVCKVSRH